MQRTSPTEAKTSGTRRFFRGVGGAVVGASAGAALFVGSWRPPVRLPPGVNESNVWLYFMGREFAKLPKAVAMMGTGATIGALVASSI